MNPVDPNVPVQLARLDQKLDGHTEYVRDALEELKATTAAIQEAQKEFQDQLAKQDNRLGVLENENGWIKRALVAVGAVGAPSTLAWLTKLIGI